MSISLHQRITNILKYNPIVYPLYRFVFSLFIKALRLFVKTDQKLIFFNSYAGRKFNDSPKAIFDVLKKDQRFREYKLVWAFHEPDDFSVDGAEKIKTDGLNYFLTALSARVWITNSSFERGLNFTGKNTFYFNTWHGTPLKKMGTDLPQGNTAFSQKGRTSFDKMMSQGRFETDIYSRSFSIPSEKFLEVGLPRNDVLAHYTMTERQRIRENLGIRSDQIVILYCPTYREYTKDKNHGVIMEPPMNLKKWEDELGGDYVLLLRAHYEVSKVMEIQENGFVRNMTFYPDLNDLYIAADILISDYSSVFFDYSITGKPMLHFAYDYEEYSSKRGLYFDIREYVNGASDEDRLILKIKTMNVDDERERTHRFQEKFVEFYGNASQAAVDCIAKELGIF